MLGIRRGIYHATRSRVHLPIYRQTRTFMQSPSVSSRSNFLSKTEAVGFARTFLSILEVDPVVFEGHGSNVPFSEITYETVAPLIGLRPREYMRDIGTFALHRSRIPTSLFKVMVQDLDNMLDQYGPYHVHSTAAARSRCLVPVFNHVVKLFDPAFRNQPATVIDRRYAGPERFDNIFKGPGDATAIFVETNGYLDQIPEKRADVIARSIAKCNNLRLANIRRDLFLPIHCIFTDGRSFEFYRYEQTLQSTFLRGCFPEDPHHHRHDLLGFGDYYVEDPLPVIGRLRSMCETIFDIMLSAYIASLRASYKRELDFEREKESVVSRPWPSSGSCARAIRLAEHAHALFRQAEEKRKIIDLKSVDALVDDALLALRKSTTATQTADVPPRLMSGWDDVQVGGL